jgi:hypothetical protein
MAFKRSGVRSSLAPPKRPEEEGGFHRPFSLFGLRIGKMSILFAKQFWPPKPPEVAYSAACIPAAFHARRFSLCQNHGFGRSDRVTSISSDGITTSVRQVANARP